MTADTPLQLGVQIFEPKGSWVDVGRLTRDGERTLFHSFDSYWERPNRPIIGQVFEEYGPGWVPSARVRLPRWFSHLLPEGRLREAIAAAADVHPEREFFLLARIGGEDLPGGVRVVHVDAAGDRPEPTSDDEAPAVEGDLGPLKFSLAGVQLKFSVQETDRGLTLPARGEAGDWIVKLPDPRPGFDGVPEAELAGLELARAAGINVPEARLVEVSTIDRLPEWAIGRGGRALLIRRFDRKPGGGRVHVEELAQALDLPTGNEKFKYKLINFETVARSTASFCGVDAVPLVIDRIVLSILVGNGDAHAKNWAYCYPNGTKAELSPLYDVVPTVLYISDENLGVNLAGSTDFQKVRMSAFARLADKAGWDPVAGRARAAEAVQRVVDAWPVLDQYLAPEAVQRLTARRDALPLLRS